MVGPTVPDEPPAEHIRNALQLLAVLKSFVRVEGGDTFYAIRGRLAQALAGLEHQ